jgi:hypothetical protein
MAKSLICTLAACLLTASASSADVQVAMNNGRVSIVAKDATVRQILTEWARVGQTKVVNVDRIPGGPVTLELTNMPEGQALDVLLKSVSGYMAAPRQTVVAGLSVFDRIIVMPTAAAPRQTMSTPSAPVFQQPQFVPASASPADDDPDEPPAPNVQLPNQPRGPVFNAFPPPQVGGPQNGPVGGAAVAFPTGQPAAPVTFGSTPTAPVGGGTSAPGMMQQPPQWQPGMPTMTPQGTPVNQPPGQPTAQPGQPSVQPGQPIRPGGRGGPGGR